MLIESHIISAELEAPNFGLLCLTVTSLNVSSLLLFEKLHFTIGVSHEESPLSDSNELQWSPKVSGSGESVGLQIGLLLL